MAYMSGDKQKFVEVEYRGLDTKNRIQNGDNRIQQNMKAFQDGNLINVHNFRVEETNEDTAIYSGQMLKDS